MDCQHRCADRLKTPFYQRERKRLSEQVHLKGFRMSAVELPAADLKTISGNQKLSARFPTGVARLILHPDDSIPGSVRLFQGNAVDRVLKVGRRLGSQCNMGELLAPPRRQGQRNLAMQRDA